MKPEPRTCPRVMKVEARIRERLARKGYMPTMNEAYVRLCYEPIRHEECSLPIGIVIAVAGAEKSSRLLQLLSTEMLSSKVECSIV